MKCHIGDAVVVDKRASNDKAVEELVRMEKDVHFAREETLRYSERESNFHETSILKLKDFFKHLNA